MKTGRLVAKANSITASTILELVKTRMRSLCADDRSNADMYRLMGNLLERGIEDAITEALVEPDKMGPSQRWISGCEAPITFETCCDTLNFYAPEMADMILEVIDAVAFDCLTNPDKIITKRPIWMPWRYFYADYQIPDSYHRSQHDKPWYADLPEMADRDIEPFGEIEQLTLLEIVAAPPARLSKPDAEMFRQYKPRRPQSALAQLALFGT